MHRGQGASELQIHAMSCRYGEAWLSAIPGMSRNGCEAIPTEQGKTSSSPPALAAVAFALTRQARPSEGLSLRIGLDAPAGADILPDFNLGALVAELEQAPTRPTGRWSLGTVGWVELEVVTGAERVS